jgi:hypothetical protein
MKHMSTAIGLIESISIDDKTKLQAIGTGSPLPVFVIVTSLDQTMKALEKATQLARPLKTRIEILDVETVPYALSLDDPSIPSAFMVTHLRDMAAQYPEKIRISTYLCRDSLETLNLILNRNCPVVIGIRKRWWPTPDERLARTLGRAGFDVIPVETD